MRPKGKWREPTQRISFAWPFLYSFVPGRGLVRNVPGKPRHKANRPQKQEKAT